MNRIIIIGNGFDLAHGLKTSYKDFIEWYWEQWGKTLFDYSESWECKDKLCTFELKDKRCSWKLFTFYNYTLAQIEGKKYFSSKQIIEDIRYKNIDCTCKITSELFEVVSDEIEINNWVDIEAEYYRLLCKSNIEDVISLNSDLNFIKEKLAEYLQEITKIRPNTISRKDFIVSPLKYQEIAIGSKASWDVFFRERIHNQNIIGKYHEHPEFVKRIVNITEKYQGNRNINYGTEAYLTTEKELYDVLFPERTLLLNFNYTKIAEDYLLRPQYAQRLEINYIHGNIGAPQNMIFGYGDDTDDNYQVIKKKQENEYLKNIKSINYLQSSEYRSLLSFVESAPFQVCIMGHSCGSSDGTLLNTLFEHKNCVSIKPYYHEKEDGTDNYFDIIGNMSRHFTDPKLMRDRVVNKEFCEPLPQVK